MKTITTALTDLFDSPYTSIATEFCEKIPYIGKTILLLCQSKIIVENVILKKKLDSFFKTFDEIPREAKELIMEYADKEFLGESIISYITRSETCKKSAFIAYLAKMLEKKKFELHENVFYEPTVEDYIRLCHVVSNCFFKDLEYLESIQPKEFHYAFNDTIPTHVLATLHGYGLLETVGFDPGKLEIGDDPVGTVYQINSEGLVIKKFLKEFKRNYKQNEFN